METTALLTSAAETTTAAAAENPASEALQEQVDKASSLFSGIGEYFIRALPDIILAVIILVVGILLSKLAARVVSHAIGRSKVDGAAKSFLVSLIRIILYIVVIIMALSAVNVPMSSIITLFGAAGLAISLALQNCLSNLCGGFIILFSKPFISGDIIEFDGSVGTVQSISILYTKVITFDNKTVFIPNGKISDAKVINYTESPTRRIDCVFSISYSSDYTKAREAILAALKTEKRILSSPAPIVRMSGHGESSINIDVLVWVNNADYLDVRYELFETVKAVFDENGIMIPFNQLDVHVKGDKNEL